MTEMQIVRFGGPEVFRAARRDSAPIAPEQVRIKVSAAGINFAEVQMRIGLYPEAPRPPFTPGFEVAGVVSETGPSVRSVRIGERVCAACRFGGYATEIVLPASHVRRVPRQLTDVEAASIPVSFMTAWIAIAEMARIREGDRVLVPGAAGGVGTAMVQVAVSAGARVVGLVGSERKKPLVRSLGATTVLTYAEWEQRADSSANAGFDAIFDARGGRELGDSIGRLAPAGRVVSYGVSSFVGGLRRSLPRVLLGLLRTPLLTPIGLAMGNKGVFGANLLKLFDTEQGLQLLGTAFDCALEGFRKGWYKPVVGKVFPLERVGAAHEYLQSRKGTGKVVLRCT
jgi:NADPH:quinone reductase-like Zn-dependent oxidoreductase